MQKNWRRIDESVRLLPLATFDFLLLQQHQKEECRQEWKRSSQRKTMKGTRVLEEYKEDQNEEES